MRIKAVVVELPAKAAPPVDESNWGLVLGLLNLVFPVAGLVLVVAALLLIVVVGGVLLLLVLGLLSVAGFVLYHWMRSWGQPAALAEELRREVVEVIELPGGRLELVDSDQFPTKALDELAARWWREVNDYQELLELDATPPVRDWENCLTTGFWQPHGAGVLLQLVRPAGKDAALTSALVWLNGQTLDWYEVAEIGPYTLWTDHHDPARLNLNTLRQQAPYQLLLLDEAAAAGTCP
jgi:hypothetical protein